MYKNINRKLIDGRVLDAISRIRTVRGIRHYTKYVSGTRFVMTLLGQYYVPGMYLHYFSAVTRYPVCTYVINWLDTRYPVSKGISTQNTSSMYTYVWITVKKIRVGNS